MIEVCLRREDEVLAAFSARLTTVFVCLELGHLASLALITIVIRALQRWR